MNTRRLVCALQSSPLWVSPRTADFRRQEECSCIAGLDLLWYWRNFRSELPQLRDLKDVISQYPQHAAECYHGPNLAFNEFWYRHEYRDVEEQIKTGRYRSGWEHYLMEGAGKQYNPTFWFREWWYQSQHPQVHGAVRSGELLCGFEHYLMYGIRQDLSPSIYFNVDWYRKQYMDASDGARSYPIVHYLLSRIGMRRCPVPFFDDGWYKQQYSVSDTTSVGGCDYVPAYEHYVIFGRRLGYSPSPYFNELAYREIYPEVAKQISAGLYDSAFEHYVKEGPANGFLARPHLEYGAVDYAGPDFVKAYQQSLLLHMFQLKNLCEVIE